MAKSWIPTYAKHSCIIHILRGYQFTSAWEEFRFSSNGTVRAGCPAPLQQWRLRRRPWQYTWPTGRSSPLAQGREAPKLWPSQREKNILKVTNSQTGMHWKPEFWTRTSCCSLMILMYDNIWWCMMCMILNELQGSGYIDILTSELAAVRRIEEVPATALVSWPRSVNGLCIYLYVMYIMFN